ncbi:hypothetical protein MNV49_003377 [Pseudohyphozyma bogoriensis]|nr:hypothetical protein MNV49_003377 [Pseudohyphozyma bogoriensis]
MAPSSPKPSTSTSTPAPPPTASTSTSKPSSSSSAAAAPPAAAAGAPLPPNVFSNDGSFLDRFKTAGGKEKDQEKTILERKKAQNDRFKNRGKRPSAPASSTDAPAKKKSKDEEEEVGLSEYAKEVRRRAKMLEGLRDEGVGIRPLNK